MWPLLYACLRVRSRWPRISPRGWPMLLVMFLVPNMLEPLMEKFRRMTEGTRILSFHFPLPVWQPEETRVVDHPHHPPPATTNMYSYTVGVRATSSSTSDTG